MRKFTGQDIHAAFVHASNEEGKPPLIDWLADWNYVQAYSKERYERMASYLNQQMEQGQEQGREHGEETQEA
jgi:hypothetical protein